MSTSTPTNGRRLSPAVCVVDGCVNRPKRGDRCHDHLLHRRYLCKKTGCEKRAQSGGFCIAHGGNACEVAGCTAGARSKSRRCIKHGGGRCTVDGCTTGAQRAGLCVKHGGRRLCAADDCTTPVSHEFVWCPTHMPRCVRADCDTYAPYDGLCEWHAAHNVPAGTRKGGWHHRVRRLYVVHWDDRFATKIGLETSARSGRVATWSGMGARVCGVWEVEGGDDEHVSAVLRGIEEAILTLLRARNLQIAHATWEALRDGRDVEGGTEVFHINPDAVTRLVNAHLAASGLTVRRGVDRAPTWSRPLLNPRT